MAKSKQKLSPPPILENIVSDEKATRAFIRYLLDIQRNTELSSGDIIGVEAQVIKNTLDIAVNSVNIALNDGRITQNEAEILQNHLDILALENDVSLLDGRVTINESNISSNTTHITTLETDATTLDGRVTQNETDISTSKIDITDLQDAGYITGAPSDGQTYGFKDGNWVVIP